MRDKDARFRQLAPTGDLFAHFGVALDPPAPPLEPAAPGAATRCKHCGWLVRLTLAACPVCALDRGGAP